MTKRIFAFFLILTVLSIPAQAAETDSDQVYCFTAEDFSPDEPLVGICITGLPESRTGTVFLGSRVVQPLTWLTSRDSSGNIRQTLCAWSLGSILNESRKDGNVLGLLLQLQIRFDGNSLSFEKVCYTPTYIWRYKQDGQYQYRIAVSDQPAPDGMSAEQAGYMEKAFRNLQKYLGDSPVTLRMK